jgi:hypothetical protein
LKLNFTALLFVVGAFLSGCFSTSLNVDTGVEYENTETRGKLYHFVLCWLKEPKNEVHRQKIIEVTKSFRDIPVVLNAQAGQVIMSDREIVDDSFDVGILIVTKNQEDLQKYLDHPIHQQAKKEVLLPLVEKILVYDFMD